MVTARSCSRRVSTSAAHAGEPAGASHVKGAIDCDCHRGRSAFQGKAEGARGHGTNNDGPPGYGARSIADSNDWTDPGETSGRSAAWSRAGLGIGERGASQGGGPGKSKTQSKERKRRSRRPGPSCRQRPRLSKRESADCSRQGHSANTRRGTKRSKCPATMHARGHQRTGREKASRQPAKVSTRQIEIRITLGTIGGHIHGERRVHGLRTHTMLDLREFDVEAEKRKTVPCSRRGPDRSLVLRMATPSRDGRETDALGHQESIDN